MNKKLILAVFLVCILVVSCTVEESKPKNLQPVSVRLKWLHQAQFAGMYVAKEKKIYQEEGLNVTLNSYDYVHRPIEYLAEGKNVFGVIGADELLIEREKGIPVKAVAVIYKKNPVVLYSLKSSGINMPEQLIGKRIGIEKSGNVEYMYRAMLFNTGINSSRVKEIPIGYDDTELINNITDVSTGYLINEPQLAIEKGYEVNMMLPEEYGVHMYADVIVTTEDMIKNNPDLVRRFVKATLTGWDYALKNEKETTDFVMLYSKDTSKLHQQNMLHSSIPLISTGDSVLGFMDKDKWENTKKILVSSKLLSDNISIDEAYTNEFIGEP
jgi:NitT/TauT family transport system substrate-binding protein